MVELVLAKTWTNTFEVGDVASHFLDGFHLLLEEVVQEVGKL
jgi:hypothetical protein